MGLNILHLGMSYSVIPILSNPIQESGILAIASVALLASSGTAIVVPYFFGRVVEAAVYHGMGKAQVSLE